MIQRNLNETGYVFPKFLSCGSGIIIFRCDLILSVAQGGRYLILLFGTPTSTRQFHLRTRVTSQHLTSRTMWKGWILRVVAIMSYHKKLRGKTVLNKYHFISIIIIIFPQMKMVVFSCHIGVTSFKLHTTQSVYVLLQGDR